MGVGCSVLLCRAIALHDVPRAEVRHRSLHSTSIVAPSPWAGVRCYEPCQERELPRSAVCYRDPLWSSTKCSRGLPLASSLSCSQLFTHCPA